MRRSSESTTALLSDRQFSGGHFSYAHHHLNFDPIKLADAVCARQGWLNLDVRFYTGTPAGTQNARWHGCWTRRLTATLLAGEGYTIGEPVTATVTVEDDDATARFTAVPDSHDGTAFEVGVALSGHIPGMSYV